MSTLVRTHTRTHVEITFADPHLRCTRCQGWVTGYHDPERCGPGCSEGWANVPCGCERAGVDSMCPSWGPVDGCRCDPVDHPVPPEA
ncbi:hypothetical protein EDC02_5955 [Micromonospora sp. Llam0]|uniref:hypothetical protein n=1 Tax=Micromonospora sp. Llam0 TaxID=2485143 RepID=UPI000F48CC2A|nr:hypothetical protein [Micromonospora sp. Llam0]ROO51091.1 hypothetical protein EDC02_5955 [Micromonospora sp. Llam0]